MAKAALILSQFHNLPAGNLADCLGALKAEIAELEGRERALRDELIRRGVPEAEGALFRVTVGEAVRWTLDSKAVKAEMGAGWYDARCRQALVTTVAVKARTSDSLTQSSDRLTRLGELAHAAEARLLIAAAVVAGEQDAVA